MIARRALLLAALALPLGAPGATADSRVVLRGGGQEMAIGPEQVVSAIASSDDYGTWTATVVLTDAAAAELASLTAALVGHSLEVLFDGRVLMAPMVMEPITGGVFLVSGLQQIEARRLAAFLRG